MLITAKIKKLVWEIELPQALCDAMDAGEHWPDLQDWLADIGVNLVQVRRAWRGSDFYYVEAVDGPNRLVVETTSKCGGDVAVRGLQEFMASVGLDMKVDARFYTNA